MTFAGCCIVSNFYIKSQPGRHCYGLWIVVQYPISTSNHNLCQATAKRARVVQYPISTSNHNLSTYSTILGKLYSIQFLHQITTSPGRTNRKYRCIVSNFYIKSQPATIWDFILTVVQYPISTSNHNYARRAIARRRVVQYPISTSNHNVHRSSSSVLGLYSIQFLHQITTVFCAYCFGASLYSIQFLHQITT